MKDIEELSKKKKKFFKNIEAPMEMENRLRGALNNEKIKSSKIRRIALTATLLIAFIFTYNYNTFAYYGKRLLGYEGVMLESLKDLNNLGKGQEIGKSIEFPGGIRIILDGVMVDDSQLLAFYRIQDPSAKGEEDLENLSVYFPSIRGLVYEYVPRSGRGEIQKEKGEIYWAQSFGPPKFIEKRLKFQGQIKIGKDYKDFSIPFTLDRNKAMGHSIKQKLNKTISIQNQEVRFKSILATNTQTIISGSLASPIELALESFKGELVRPSVDFTLLVDGKVYEPTGGSLSTNTKGITFDHIFESLPENIQDLKIGIIGLTIDKRIKKVIPIEKGRPQIIEEGEVNLEILDIEETKYTTEITIKSNEDVLFPDIKLIVDGEDIKLDQVHSEDYEKTMEGELFKIRTLSFKGKGNQLKLEISKIHYKKEVYEVVDIPLK